MIQKCLGITQYQKYGNRNNNRKIIRNRRCTMIKINSLEKIYDMLKKHDEINKYKYGILTLFFSFFLFFSSFFFSFSFSAWSSILSNIPWSWSMFWMVSISKAWSLMFFMLLKKPISNHRTTVLYRMNHKIHNPLEFQNRN